ncbi:MAG: class I SAM-dependent methyltransferase [Thermoplasmata archaeon]
MTAPALAAALIAEGTVPGRSPLDRPQRRGPEGPGAPTTAAPTRRPGPVDRVRARVAARLGAARAGLLPRGYVRLGRVVQVRLPEALGPWYPFLGTVYAEELGAAAVLVPTGPIEGQWRHPRLQVIHAGPTETEVLEHGVRWRFDARELMFARGNKAERARVRTLVQPGERVYDLFAGIGYFAIPAALADPTVRVEAVEANPVAFRYLVENVRRNGVAGRVRCHLGDNRTVGLAAGAADRILMGYLPSSVPWLGRAIDLLDPAGGWLSVHLIADVDSGPVGAGDEVTRELLRIGAVIVEIHPRWVKSYGPGRIHAVVDVRIGPRAAEAPLPREPLRG